ncbi:MAG: phage holin family protein [bacterium]|nr:phage holin family protein [bacterium]
MATLLVKWLVNALAVFFVGYFLAEHIHVPDFTTALWVALVLGVVNVIIRPILLIITLPINILSLGLFTFVVNGLMFWLVAKFVKDFSVDGFWWAIFGALIVSVTSTILNRFFLGKDGKVGGN